MNIIVIENISSIDTAVFDGSSFGYNFTEDKATGVVAPGTGSAAQPDTSDHVRRHGPRSQEKEKLHCERKKHLEKSSWKEREIVFFSVLSK